MIGAHSSRMCHEINGLTNENVPTTSNDMDNTAAEVKGIEKLVTD